jgi:hypothetical protein
MATAKQKVEVTWLQCQLPKPDWEALNKRRLALNLKWADILVLATLEYLDKLEANPPAPKPGTETKQPKTKRQPKAPPKAGKVTKLEANRIEKSQKIVSLEEAKATADRLAPAKATEAPPKASKVIKLSPSEGM